MSIQFGEFSLDAETRQLHRAAKEVHLSTKAFDLLKLLIEARPRVVSKHELQEALWPGINVSEASLFTLISEVRTATGDDARDSRFVRTVHGVGYAFSGEAAELPLARIDQSPRVSSFVLISGARRITLAEGENVIGRDTDLSVSLTSSTVSRRHACMTIAGDRATVKDLGSRNGTFVNEQRIDSVVSLKDGDQIRVGSILCTIHLNIEGETQPWTPSQADIRIP
jgi:DNA-binding winged helix-turn-helix (wHTH) protein